MCPHQNMPACFLPEGKKWNTEQNKRFLSDIKWLQQAAAANEILEAVAVSCNASHDLILDLFGIRGIIPREEGALGIREGLLRDIALIARTGKHVAFCVERIDFDALGNPTVICSRRKAQERCKTEYLSLLTPGDLLPARVTHLEPFGAFLDIGCGIHALLPIDCISTSRINHPAQRLKKGQDVFVALRQIDEKGRFLLTMKELLGSWEENAACFSVGDTVCGRVRSKEDYGVFIELTPNLTGLAEKKGEVEPGMMATVYIKSILPEKMKIKLVLVDSFFAEDADLPPLRFFQTTGHMDSFLYSPACCSKRVETVFL